MCRPCGRIMYLLAVAALLLLATTPAMAQKLPAVNINEDLVAVAGVSSGAAMAIQMHVAYSKTFHAVGALAGPPYWCAMAQLSLALTSCEGKPWLIDLDLLWAGVDYAASVASIDDPSNIAHDRVWLFSGTQDTVVNPGVVKKALAFYQHYMTSKQDTFIGNVSAAHAWITADYGNACDYFGSPYINNCGFDSAGSMLRHFFPSVQFNARANSVNASSIFAFDQQYYTPLSINPSNISMGQKGFVYIPESCKSTACGMIVVFHGCEQTFDQIGMEFILHNGMNQWAESNNLVVLYPQAIASPVVPYNPLGCWDWWGYTGPEYASKLGPQMASVKSMMNALAAAY